jgi:hypothetical protein
VNLMAHYSTVNRQLIRSNQTNSKYKKQQKLSHKKMTCIIGGKCKDGVVLVADRKVILQTGSVESREKIFMDFHPFVVASSGYATSFDNFRREAKDLAIKSRGYYGPQQQNFTTVSYNPAAYSGVTRVITSDSSNQHPVIPLHSYLDGLKNIVKKYKSELKNDPTYKFDVLVASRAEDTGSAYLSYIDDNGMMDDIDTWKQYIVIGSYETRVSAEFLIKSLWTSNKIMNEFAELACFIIKYVDRFKTDNDVGLETQKPLVWWVPNNGPIVKASESLMETLDLRVNQMLDNFSMYGLKLLETRSS